MASNPVIPSGAAQLGPGYSAIGGVVEGPLLALPQQERSLHYASLSSASVGTTVFSALCKCPALARETNMNR